MMKLYTYPLTSNAIKVSLLLNELQLGIEQQLIELQKGQQKEEAFLSINPNGSIPVLVDADYILWESNAILFHLANKYESSLMPESPGQLTELIRWLSWQQETWLSATAVYAHQRIVLKHWQLSANAKRLQQAERKLPQAAAVLEQQLSWQDFVLGDQLSIADVALASTLMFWREAEIPLTGFQNIQQWLLRLEDQSWWQQTRQDLERFRNL